MKHFKKSKMTQSHSLIEAYILYTDASFYYFSKEKSVHCKCEARERPFGPGDISLLQLNGG